MSKGEGSGLRLHGVHDEFLVSFLFQDLFLEDDKAKQDEDEEPPPPEPFEWTDN